jgi:aspartyl-tRNA(Asn)/glutamyl-tRNA(Gln) amidotransferase subunit A
VTIVEFGRKLRAGETTAERATEECLERIRAGNSRLNAFIAVTADEARRQAREADRTLAAGGDAGPLHGVPVSLKDLLDVKGMATTAASRVRDGHIAAHDCTAVAHLRRAGAVFLGKTNLHEFAFGTTSEDSAFGPARNPHDPERSPGGSSGGSAASVAAGMALATVGTDTGGSIRIPAASCGIVGLKPTFGEVDTSGVVPLSRTFDHVGPLARSVADAWLMYAALTGRYSARVPAAAPRSTLRLGVPRRYFCDLLDEEVRARFETALGRLAEAGARVDEVDIRHADDIAAVYLHISVAEAAAYHAVTLESVPDRYTPNVRLRLEMGRYIPAEDYVRALAGRDILTREVDTALADRDALVLPTLPIPAPLIGATTARLGANQAPVRAMMLRLTQLFNMTGHPAISLPSGNTASGLPTAVQLVGRRGETDHLVRVALAAEELI